MDHVAGVEVLRRRGGQLELTTATERRKFEHVGHVMGNGRKYRLLRNVTRGKVKGRENSLDGQTFAGGSRFGVNPFNYSAITKEGNVSAIRGSKVGSVC